MRTTQVSRMRSGGGGGGDDAYDRAKKLWASLMRETEMQYAKDGTDLLDDEIQTGERKKKKQRCVFGSADLREVTKLDIAKAEKRGPGPILWWNKTEPMYQVERLRDVRTLAGGRREYLVHWTGYPACMDTWEEQSWLLATVDLREEMAALDREPLVKMRASD